MNLVYNIKQISISLKTEINLEFYDYMISDTLIQII